MKGSTVTSRDRKDIFMLRRLDDLGSTGKREAFDQLRPNEVGWGRSLSGESYNPAVRAELVEALCFFLK